MLRKKHNMDMGWRFCTADEDLKTGNDHAVIYNASKSGVCKGPAGKEFYDGGWKKVDLPHDYFVAAGFDKKNTQSHGYKNRYNAWYRKSFLLDDNCAGRSFTLVFEGIAGKSVVYLNGFLLHKTTSTYTENIIDVTDYLYFGDRPNVIAVFVDGSTFEGWWYEGAGIYRHVYLYEKEPVHIEHNGVFVKPKLISETANDWNVPFFVDVKNSSYEDADVKAVAELWKKGEKVSQGITETATVRGGDSTELCGSFTVAGPKRWDVDDPQLYEVRVSLYDNNRPLDREEIKTGFRTISIDADNGFFLNGKRLLIKGTCNHQDHAGVGVALSDSLHYYRIKRLKEMGSNAYRCAHHMPAKEILNACDELGMIVMDENRHFQSDSETLSQIDNMVRRDRNHPSVMFWSVFNEEPLQSCEEGARIFRRIKQYIKSLDDSRLITGAISGPTYGIGVEMDVAGVNYCLDEIVTSKKNYPDLPVFGTENNSAVSTRGCYISDRENAHILNNYDEEVVPWGSNVRDMWRFINEHPYMAGFFIWTGFDYRGEPTPFSWPSVSSQFGIMDTCGFAKDSFYYNKACFTEEPFVHLLPHWNWQNGDNVRVVAVTNCDEAELFLNGNSLGKKAASVYDPPEWNVTFEKGALFVKAYKRGRQVAVDERQTAGEPYKIVLTADRQSINDDGQDTVLINAAVVDKKGVLCPNATNKIHFDILGDGVVLGTGNGNPNSHEDDTKPYRYAFYGLCQAIVRLLRKGSEIKVVASSDGLQSADIDIAVHKVEQPLFIDGVENDYIGGFSVSKIFEIKPDPLIKVTDQDMNTFSPISIPLANYQPGFLRGWRIYRVACVLPSIPSNSSTADYKLIFSDIKGADIEVYIDGKLCSAHKQPSGGQMKIGFSGIPQGSVEIRILIKADSSTNSGISKAVRLLADK